MEPLQKKTILKWIVWIALFVLLGILASGYYKKLLYGRDHTITIGVFSDSYWEVQNGYSYRILDDAIAAFEKEHPGVKVEYTSGVMKKDYSKWLAGHLVKGDAPDVFFVLKSDFNELSETGALMDLSEFMDRDQKFHADGYYQAALLSGKYLDTQYALPYECAPKLMFVNKTILNQEGISMPAEDWTWDDFYELCAKVTKDTDGDGVIDQFGLTGYSWKDAFRENGVSIFTEDGSSCNLLGEDIEAAIHHIERLNDLSNGYSVTAKDFDHGNVAFMPMLFSEYRAYKSYPLSIKKYSGFEWECVAMPAGPDGDNVSTLDTLLLGMNANTAHEQLAWEFMKQLTTDTDIQSEIFDYSEGVSVLKEVTESDETRIVLERAAGENVTMNPKVLGDVLDHAVVEPAFHNYDLALQQVDQMMQDIIGGDQNISMELIISNRKINQYLKDMQSN